MINAQEGKQALAHIRGGPEFPRIQGTISFKQLRRGVLVTAKICNLPSRPDSDQAIFALHIHEGLSCGSPRGQAFPLAGGHYNPQGYAHPWHAGDLPPLFSNGGYAYMSVLTSRFTVEEIIGRVVIIHSHPDDFTTQPAGNPGDKIACGKILAKS